MGESVKTVACTPGVRYNITTNMREKLTRVVDKYHYSAILLKQLVVTEFKLRYQGSVLGYLWSLMRPLFLFLIMYVVFVYFLRIGSDVPHWPVQLLLGIVLWNFFAEVTNNGITAIVDRGEIIRKINFPKYVIVLSSVASALINLLINTLVIVVFILFNGVTISWHMLLFPLLLLELVALGLGVAFLLSAAFVKLRDINYIWEILMQGLFYASVVIYPLKMIIDKVPGAAHYLLLNPVAQIIQDARYALISPETPTLMSLTHGNVVVALIPVAAVLILLVVGARVFKNQSASFAENV